MRRDNLQNSVRDRDKTESLSAFSLETEWYTCPAVLCYVSVGKNETYFEYNNQLGRNIRINMVSTRRQMTITTKFVCNNWYVEVCPIE